MSKIWDGYIRFFHWFLVIAIIGLYLSAEQGNLAVHFLFGYFTLALLATRLIWGIIGSDTAKLSRLFHRPKAIVQALKGQDNTVGHNPLGSYMVLVFFALITTQLVTGLMTSDDILTDGPLVAHVPSEWVELASSLHKQNFDWLLIAIGLHICAIVVYRLRGKNLVKAMITGKSDASPAPPIKPAWRAFVIFAVLLALLAFTWAKQPLSELFL